VALIRGFAGWGGLTRMHAHAVTAYRLLPVGHPAHELSALGLGCSLMLLGRTERAVPFLEEASALGAARASAALVAHGVLAQIAWKSSAWRRPRRASVRGSASSANSAWERASSAFP
jgi:hypothetical protein